VSIAKYTRNDNIIANTFLFGKFGGWVVSHRMLSWLLFTPTPK